MTEDGTVVVAVMSHRDPPLLRRLVDRILEGERTVALVHHDPRAQPHGLVENERVRLVREPQPCNWGRMDQAETVLRCAAEAVRTFPEMRWLVVVSGQDYPAQSVRTTERELLASDADAFVRHLEVTAAPPADEIPWQAACRRRYLRRRRLPGSRRSVPFPRRHPFGEERRLYIGDTWVNLSTPAVHHVLEQFDRLGQVRRYFDSCSNPDEALLPTLLLNDADDLRIVNDRKRFIRWSPGAAHPEVLTEDDAPQLLASGAYFGRKVELPSSRALLDRLDAAAVSDQPGA